MDKPKCNSKFLLLIINEAGEVSVAGVIDPGNLTPMIMDDNEQEPVSRAVEGCEEATIVSDQSQGPQQEEDTMQSQTSRDMLRIAENMAAQQVVAAPSDLKP